MQQRDLGKTGLQVSEIGFGAWGIGGVSEDALSYGPTDDQESLNALRRARELGVTFYDTADLYGSGHSEELIGFALKPHRRKITIASKGGFLNARGGQDFSISHLKQSLEASLLRLETDYLDLYQLHDMNLDLLQRNPHTLAFLNELKTNGMIRAIGICVRTPEDGLRAVREFGFQSIQVNFNLVDQRARENGLLDLCEKENVGVICRTPLCFGFLTGKYAPEHPFHAQDQRKRWQPKQIEMWARAHETFNEMIHAYPDQTPAQFALRFCLSYPAVSTVIPGMLTTQHVEENCKASTLGPLTDDERKAIEKIYHEHVFFLGKEC